MIAIIVQVPQNKPQSHPRKSNHPSKFPDDPSEESGLSETQRSLPSCFSKDWAGFDSFSVLANKRVWNRALYHMNYLHPANCFLALSSCGSSWFTTFKSEPLFWGRKVLLSVWKTCKFGSLYNYLHELYPEDLVCGAGYSWILQRTKQPMMVLSRGDLPTTIKITFI